MTKTLTMTDGAEIAVTASGAGQPIVFLHGWAMRGDLFDAQRQALEADFQVVSYDLRGHGGSRQGGAPPTIERLGADLVELCAQLDLQRAICVGWSMGSMTAWEAMATDGFADRVAGLVSIDMSPRLTNDSAWKLGLADGRRPESTLRAVETMREDWPGMVRRFVPRIFAADNFEKCGALIQAIIKEASALDGHTLASLWESMAVQDFRKFLGMLKTPMLAIHGAKSQLYPIATGEYVAQTAPNAELVVFAESGHAPHLEEPARFNETLRNFINRLNERPAASPIVKAAG